MNRLNFLLPLPTNEANFKPLISKGNSFLKENKLVEAWNCYQKAFLNLGDNWGKFNNDYYLPESGFIPNTEYKFVYCPIPKVASSSLKYLILRLSNLDNKTNLKIDDNIHIYVDKNLSFFSYKYYDVIKILSDESYFKFVLVRNPWSRCLSAYLDKLVKEKNTPLFSPDIMTDICRYKKQKLDAESSLTFAEFVRYLSRTKDHKLNWHWKSQYSYLGSTKFDFIGKVENLEEDFEYIKNKLNLPDDLPYRNISLYTKDFSSNPFDIHWSKLTPLQLRNINYYPKYQEFYTEELIELVRNRYLKDVKTFGYEFI